MAFQDHFSAQSDIYLKARPTYPQALFAYLAGISPATQLCWDAATGNGQAAVSLAAYFTQVIATDGSPQQIANAIPAPNVTYRVGTAEQSGLGAHSVDLITAATAAHWFNHTQFYAEAERVLKPGGVIALWTYSEAHITPAINELMEWFMYTLLYNYWPDGRWYVRNKYQTLPFPYAQLSTPAFNCTMQWQLPQWLNYVRSWSAYNNYIKQHNADPIEELLPRLTPLWAEGETKTVTWPLHLKCAQMPV